MALNEEQQQEVIDWYQLHVKKCPLCESENFRIEAIVGMPELLKSGPNPKGGFPAIPIMCASCGYTILLAATAMKFYQPMRPPT